MQRKDDEMYSDMINNFINDIDDSSNNNKKKVKNKKTKENKNENKHEKKKEEKNIENNNEEVIQIKLIKLENELLIKKIKEKDNEIKDYKKKFKDQNHKIIELQKQIKEIYNKEKNKNKIIPKQKEKNKFINDKFEENLALKAVEEQLLKEIRQKKDDIYKMDKLDKIENIKFDIDRAEFFQCGICMDSFQDGEQLKKLSCLHLYHKDCLNQWIQTKKDCPLCGKFINI